MQLEKLKNDFINLLIKNENSSCENIQKNLVTYDEYNKILNNAYEVIKNNKDDDINDLREKIYNNSNINKDVYDLIYNLEIAPSFTISYGTKNYQEFLSAGSINNQDVTNNNIYDLASVSKLFTSISILNLASKGIIDLNKDVTYYDEDFRFLKGVTIFNLLTFSTPLITNGRLDEKDISYEESKNRLYNVKINENFSSNLNPYTDLGAMVLKEIICKITNQNFYEFVNENILLPAKMNNTFINVPKDKLSLLAPTDNTIIYKNGSFVFRNIPLGIVNDEKAQILGQNVNDFTGHAGIFSTPENMTNFALNLLNYNLLDENYLKNMSKNVTGKFLEKTNSYRQFFGCLCYSKNPDSKNTEVYHPLSGPSFAMGGYTGNQFTLDPENQIFAFLLANRTNNRVSNISGFDKSKIIKYDKGKETILINNKEYIKSSSFATKRDKVLRNSLNLSLNYLFLEYYINIVEKDILLNSYQKKYIKKM